MKEDEVEIVVQINGKSKRKSANGKEHKDSPQKARKFLEINNWYIVKKKFMYQEEL